MKKFSYAAICAVALGVGFLSCRVPAMGAADDIRTTDGIRITDDIRTTDGIRITDNNQLYENEQPVTEQWVTKEGETYYFDEDGNPSVSKCKIDGIYYVFDQEGRLMQPSAKKVMQVEDLDGEVKKYYVDTDGKALSGWSKDKNYYFDKSKEMVTGVTVIDKKFYCFQANGKYNKGKTQKIRKAAKYEKPFANLKKYIGKPKKSRYYASCYGNGKDGKLSYNGYFVYTFKPAGSGAEIFMGVE